MRKSVHLDQDYREHLFEFKGRKYKAVYLWDINGIAIFIESTSGKWVQIDANTKKAEQMISEKNMSWGDYRAPIKRSEQATAR